MYWMKNVWDSVILWVFGPQEILWHWPKLLLQGDLALVWGGGGGGGGATFPRKEAPKAMVILLLAQVCNGEQCVPQVAFYLDSSHASTIFILCHCILQVMDAGLRTVLWWFVRILFATQHWKVLLTTQPTADTHYCILPENCFLLGFHGQGWLHQVYLSPSCLSFSLTFSSS